MTDFFNRIPDRLLIALYFGNLALYLLVNIFNDTLPEIDIVLLLIHVALLIALMNGKNGWQWDKKENLDEWQMLQKLRAHSQSWTLLALGLVISGFAAQLLIDAEVALPQLSTEAVIALLFSVSMAVIALPYVMLTFSQPAPLLED